MTDLSQDHFAPDAPWAEERPAHAFPEADRIEGLRCTPLNRRTHAKGALCELITARPGVAHAIEEPVVHAYLVTAAPGSVRAWVFHERQADRLAITDGDIVAVLYDLREDSPTHGALVELELGAAAPGLLRIPPGVVHGVWNRGDRDAIFVNMPTTVFDLADPDKKRLAIDDPRIPYRFE